MGKRKDPRPASLQESYLIIEIMYLGSNHGVREADETINA